MWKCGNCGEDVEDDFEVCWNCQTERGAASPTEGTSAISATPVKAARPVRRPAALGEQLGKRYRDAYRVARVTVFFGDVAKGLAFVFGSISLVFAFAVSGRSTPLALVAGLFGAFAGLLLYVAGVLVAVLGQLLLTCIDQVINTSPFLTDSERAAIMRVAVEEAEEKSGNAAD